MARKFLHLVYIPMRGVGVYDKLRDDAWFAYRIGIFKDYTLKSLLNQKNRNFILWLSFRPEDQKSLLVAELANHLRGVGMEYILTFDGLMYWDDKFNKDIISRLKNVARIVRHCLRNRTVKPLLYIQELWKNKNDTLQERAQKSLNKIRQHFRDLGTVYLTRIDSDDMFHEEAVNDIQMAQRGNYAYVFKEGYIYDANRSVLAEYHPKTNPPFHTIYFPANVFFDAERYLDHFGNFKSHEDIVKVFETIRLPDYRYCVVTHNREHQISTVFNHPFRGKIIMENKEKILKEFGI